MITESSRFLDLSFPGQFWNNTCTSTNSNANILVNALDRKSIFLLHIALILWANTFNVSTQSKIQEILNHQVNIMQWYKKIKVSHFDILWLQDNGKKYVPKNHSLMIWYSPQTNFNMVWFNLWNWQLYCHLTNNKINTLPGFSKNDRTRMIWMIITHIRYLHKNSISNKGMLRNKKEKDTKCVCIRDKQTSVVQQRKRATDAPACKYIFIHNTLFPHWSILLSVFCPVFRIFLSFLFVLVIREKIVRG